MSLRVSMVCEVCQLINLRNMAKSEEKRFKLLLDLLYLKCPKKFIAQFLLSACHTGHTNFKAWMYGNGSTCCTTTSSPPR